VSPRALENIAAPKPETFGVGLSTSVSRGQASFRDALRRANQTAIRERDSDADEASTGEEIDARADADAARQADAPRGDDVARSRGTPEDDSPQPPQEADVVDATTEDSSPPPPESKDGDAKPFDKVDEEASDSAAALVGTTAIVPPPATAPLPEASAVTESAVEAPEIEAFPAASPAAPIGGASPAGAIASVEGAADAPTPQVDAALATANIEVTATIVETVSSEQAAEQPTNLEVKITGAQGDAAAAADAAIVARAAATAGSRTTGVASNQASAKSGTSDGETASGDKPRERGSDETAVKVVADARPLTGSPATAPSTDVASAAAAKLVERIDGERAKPETHDAGQSPHALETQAASKTDVVAVEGVPQRGGQVPVATGVRGSEAAEPGGSLTQAERGRLIARVARAMQTAHDRGGELKLRLSPPELGSLRLQVQVADGVLTARIEAETREAQQIITDNLLVLRDRLAQQDIRIERLSVDLFNSGTGGGAGTPQHGFDRQADGGGAARFGTSELRKDGAEAGPAPAARSVASASSSGLNVVV